MKLVRFGEPGCEQPGLLVGERIVALRPLLARAGIDLKNEHDLIALWPQIVAIVEPALAEATWIDLQSVRLGSPLEVPRAIVAVGFNYRQHGAETVGALPFPKTPILFLKPQSSLAGPFDPIRKPPETNQLDYELELGVVIGKPCHRVSAQDALDHVFGFVAANDVSARDTSMGEAATHPMFMQVARGKGSPTFCPLGPWIATRDEIADIEALRLQLWVNDEPRQDDHAASMAVGVPELIASISESFALQPGDIILTGTPGGCAFQSPSAAFLQPGDIVRGQITGLGEMRNPIVVLNA